MQKFILFLAYNFFLLSYGYSQDYLIKKNGDSLKVKIVETNLTEVKYKEYKNLMGITYGIYKSDVLRIRYQNGRVESFTPEELAKSMSPEEKCSCGRSDAAKYHGLKGGAFACGAYCGPFVLLGTAITKQTPKMGMRTSKISEHKNLFQDPYYLKCYNKKAKADLLGMEAQGLAAVILIPIVIMLLLL
jgi:hypothetical protein